MSKITENRWRYYIIHRCLQKDTLGSREKRRKCVEMLQSVAECCGGAWSLTNLERNAAFYAGFRDPPRILRESSENPL